jgi:integrase
MSPAVFYGDWSYFPLFSRQKENKRKMEKINFTKRTLETLPVPDGDRYVLYRDLQARGLGVKVEPSGRKTFFWSRKALGQAQWKTIGEFADVTLDRARAEANSFNIDRERWRASGENPFARPADITLGEIIDQYVERWIKLQTSRPERAVKDVEGQRDRCLKHFVGRKIASIRKPEILALREAVHKKRGPSSANRLMQMLRAAINWAIRTELWDGDNVVENIPKFDEHPRERFLYKNELDSLAAALAETPNRDLADFVKLALVTGARKSDITSMRWSDVSLDAAVWVVPHPKNKTPYRVALVKEAVEILRVRHALHGSGPWVFPSPASASGHVHDMKRSWGQLLKRAGIKDVHQHDLRHTLGAWSVIAGSSLHVIGASLGHKSQASTAIYAHVGLDTVRSSVENATARMFEAPKTKLLPAAPEGRKKVRRA